MIITKYYSLPHNTRYYRTLSSHLS